MPYRTMDELKPMVGLPIHPHANAHLHPSDHAQYVAELAQVMTDLASTNDRPVSLDAGRWVMSTGMRAADRAVKGK